MKQLFLETHVYNTISWIWRVKMIQLKWTQTTNRSTQWLHNPTWVQVSFWSYTITLQSTSHLSFLKMKNPVGRFSDLCPQSLGFNYLFCIFPFSGSCNSLQQFSSKKKKELKGKWLLLCNRFQFSLLFILYYFQLDPCGEKM